VAGAEQAALAALLGESARLLADRAIESRLGLIQLHRDEAQQDLVRCRRSATSSAAPARVAKGRRAPCGDAQGVVAGPRAPATTARPWAERTGGGRVGTFGKRSVARPRVAARGVRSPRRSASSAWMCRRCAQARRRRAPRRAGSPRRPPRGWRAAVGDQVGDIDLSTDRRPAAKRVAQLRHGEHALQVGPGGLVRVTRRRAAAARSYQSRARSRSPARS
jgi:hypothetical protein